MQLLSVNYHYIREQQYHQGIYPTSIASLSKQIDKLAQFYQFISNEELADKIEKQEFDNNNYCLLTFDDGLKEQMEAFDVLKSRGIPAVFYIPTSAIEHHLVLDVHKLHYVRTILDDVQIDQILSNNDRYSCYPFDDSAIAKQYLYETNPLSRKIKFFLNFVLDRQEMHRMINELFIEVVNDEIVFSKKLYMDISDLKKINQYKCLGTHSSRHFPLANATKTKIREDIQESVDYLHIICSTDLYLKSISYPFGRQNAVNDKVIDVVSEFDFNFGLTMFRGMNSNENFKSPLKLKRIDTNDAPGGKLNSREYYL